MGLHLKNKVVLVIPGNNSRIISKHRDAPVPLPQLLSDLTGGALYIGVKQAANNGYVSPRSYSVLNLCIENFVLAALL